MELFNQIDELKQELDFLPYVNVQLHTLANHTSLFIKVSLDDPESWYFGIFENSRFAKVSISSNGKMEVLSRSRETAKMRKCTVQNVKDVVKKLKKWKEDSSIVL